MRDNNDRNEGTEKRQESMDMVDPTRVQEAVEAEWATSETQRKSALERLEEAFEQGFDKDGKVRKDIGEEPVGTVSGISITKDDVEDMRDRNKSTEEILREIRDELRDTPTQERARTDGGHGHTGNGHRDSVSKANVVLKEEDFDNVLEEFYAETDLTLADPNGMDSFREWLESRVYTDGPGGGPREEKILEELEEKFDEIREAVRESVAAATDGGEDTDTDESAEKGNVSKSLRTNGGVTRRVTSAEDLPPEKHEEYAKAAKRSSIPDYNGLKKALTPEAAAKLP